jgi:hypothetical protein
MKLSFSRPASGGVRVENACKPFCEISEFDLASRPELPQPIATPFVGTFGLAPVK